MDNNLQNSNVQNKDVFKNTSKEFLNPNNFRQVLDIPQDKALENQGSSPISALDAKSIEAQYKALQESAIKTNKKVKNEYDLIKLVLYTVPVIAILFLIIKPINNYDVKWHTKQSLVAQGIWFLVMIILNVIHAYILSSLGLTLWDILCYGLLIIAGISAYNGNRFHIPVVYEIGKSFIEE